MSSIVAFSSWNEPHGGMKDRSGVPAFCCRGNIVPSCPETLSTHRGNASAMSARKANRRAIAGIRASGMWDWKKQKTTMD